MYKRIETDEPICINDKEHGLIEIYPVATLVNDIGQKCQIAYTGGSKPAYGIYLENDEGTYILSPHMFEEVYDEIVNVVNFHLWENKNENKETYV